MTSTNQVKDEKLSDYAQVGSGINRSISHGGQTLLKATTIQQSEKKVEKW